MTMPRQVVPGRTYLFTRRCLRRQFFLRPDDNVNALYEYLLAEAAERFHITLHAFIAMSNHQHVLFRDNDGNFPEFLRHLDAMIAIMLLRYWGMTEYFWSSAQANVVHCVEADDRFREFLYVHTNAINEDQVDRVSDWPGASSLSMVLSGREKVIERPKRFFGERSTMPKEVTLRCVRPEGFEHLSEEEWTKKITDAIASAETAARAKRVEENRRVLGRKAILRAKHTDVPSSVESRSDHRPEVACQNAERREVELDALRAFRAKYRAMFEKWIAKAADVLFPRGTYRLRVLGLPCVPFDDVALPAPA